MRNFIAWLRSRWHADLEFQGRTQRQSIQDRIDQAVGGVGVQLERLSALEHQLSALDMRFQEVSSELARQPGRLTNLEAALSALALELSARVQSAANDVYTSIHAAASLATDKFSSLGALIAEGERLHQVRDQGVREMCHALELRVTEIATALCATEQAAQQSSRMILELLHEVREERQRNQELAAQRELFHQQELAAQKELAAPQERIRWVEREAVLTNALTEAELAAIERKGVFVVGCARSGTTILCDCLNVSPDVYMLQEASFFSSAAEAHAAGRDNYDFAVAFNQRHVGYGNQRAKGTYVPTAEVPDRTPLAFLHRLGPKYRFLGDKLAFGPAQQPLGAGWEDSFLAYQARHFYHSRYFITVRAPNEAIWSMHKMFPGSGIPMLFEAWLRSLRTSLDLYLAFPNTHLMLLDWFDERMIAQIAEILQVDISLPRGMVTRAAQSSALPEGEVAPVLRPFAAWCGECTDLYAELRSALSVHTLQFANPANRREHIGELRMRISSLLERMFEPVAFSLAGEHRAA